MKHVPAVLLFAPLAILACAQSPQAPTASTRTVAVSGPDGLVRGSAVGDEKTGPGELEIFNVRMDRQDPRTGASILRQYANPGQTYQMGVGEQIELWVEYRGAVNPRVRVDWGAGESERFDGHVCGSCRLYHTYPSAGTFTVVVTIDDQAGTVVRRTFVLNSRPTEFGTLTVSVTGSFCTLPHLLGPGGIDCTTTGGTCSATLPAGSTVTLTFNNASCTVFNGWLGACAGVGTGAGTSASCTFILPAGASSVTLKTLNSD